MPHLIQADSQAEEEPATHDIHNDDQEDAQLRGPTYPPAPSSHMASVAGSGAQSSAAARNAVPSKSDVSMRAASDHDASTEAVDDAEAKHAGGNEMATTSGYHLDAAQGEGTEEERVFLVLMIINGRLLTALFSVLMTLKAAQMLQAMKRMMGAEASWMICRTFLRARSSSTLIMSLMHQKTTT